jgi:repressor LexA
LPPKPVVQNEILDFIKCLAEADGRSPTLQEIADAFGIAKTTVHEHVSALVRKGLLARKKNKARGIEVKGDRA